MVKPDFDRDYYADLELSSAAEVAEVKKQFKKLALKYHPDRNPGKEDEAKEKFLVIQAAHEILTDASQKAKYDAYRIRAARYGAASGVKGNPYMYTSEDINSRYGPPPTRRPQMPTRPVHTNSTATGGSSRYQSWTPKPKSKTEAFRTKSEAWDRSRASTNQESARATKSGGVPPTPPRSAAQYRRQEAAFGARTRGFAPSSPVGDEPQVKSQHYNTHAGPGETTSSSAQQPKPRPKSDYIDPLSQQFGETFLDNRQRTPYATNVGEKTNPHEPLNNVNRAKSMRDNERRYSSQTAPAPPPRQRSVSVDSEGLRKSATNEPNPPMNNAAQNQRPQYTSKASARYSPRTAQSPTPDFAFTSGATAAAAGFGAATAAAFGGPNSSTSTVNSTANVNSDGVQAKPTPKVYEFPLFSQMPPSASSGLSGSGSPTKRETIYPHGLSSRRAVTSPLKQQKQDTPSGEKQACDPDQFSHQLNSQIEFLLSQKGRVSGPPASGTGSMPENNMSRAHENANAAATTSFAVPEDDDPVQQARFERHSADSINTQFVNEESGNFEFSAGTDGSGDDFSRARNKFRGRQSPLRNEFRSSRESGTGFSNPGQQGPVPPRTSGFDAATWEAHIGPELFEPKPTTRTSVSPTRPIRPMKKARPVRMTAGTAGVVDDGSTSGEDRAQSAGPNISGSRSPNAMDIDPPHPESSSQPQPVANEPRNIPVEPTKPEWRAGNGIANPIISPGGGVPLDPRPAGGVKLPKLNLNAAGSEDTEDFMRPMFEEFKNVEPFNQKATGLNSFADLSTNLPFQSKPSSRAPIAHEKPAPLVCPPVPQPPKAGVGLTMTAAKLNSPAWATYAQEFQAYLVKWSEWDKQMISHFNARQTQHEKFGFAWVVSGTGDSQAEKDYMIAQELDKPIRQKWLAAHDAHEIHVKQFQQLREGLMRERR
ncbi:DnaJ-related protein rsp1 [Podospora fimiseda]|uniref:DnaJ-related protein rsp1 n=1 Tax=Podospora fimiseda TaxID=252190 RepID=A0AAN7H2A2_9PEZI|nr:DnaJ-related protein rsp1 [Podospora fimiseda]